ncbi:thyrotropin-releasing hormone receptor-like isoform X2 [Rhodnius prolixus]
MVVLVVSKVMALHSPTNYYLVSLAIADTVVLLASVPQEVLSYYLVGNQWIWGNVGCSLMIYCQNLGINASSLSLVTLTVERYIAICHPMKAHKICTIGRAKKITVGMWVFAIFYCSPWLFLTETVPVNYRGYPEIHQCIFKRPREEYLVGFFLDLVLFYVIPLILSCILYTLIIRSLNERGKVTVKGAPKGSVALEAVNTHSKSQVVKMLAVVVAVFAVLWLPYRGLLVYNSFMTLFGKSPFMDLWYLMFAKTCVYINSAINPFLYNAMSTKFRRAFHRMLVCKRATRPPVITISTVAGPSLSSASSSHRETTTVSVV